MIWPLLLICISNYSWYLIFTNNAVTINVGELLIGLIFNSLLPAFWALALNSKLSFREPTITTTLRKNLQQFLLYNGLFSLINILRGNYLNLPLRLAWLLPFIWQGLSWFCGINAVFQLISPLKKTGSISLRAVESSFIIFLPALIILHLMGAPFITLFLLLAGWLIALFITLDMEGHGVQKKHYFRYDLIVLHLFVPVVTAALLFFITFSQEAYFILKFVQKKIINMFFAAANYLNHIFLQGFKGKKYLEPNSSSKSGIREIVPPLREMPPWLGHFFILVAAICLLTALSILVKVVKNRNKSKLVLKPRSRTKAKVTIRQLLLLVKSWLRNILKSINGFIQKIGILFKSLGQKIVNFIRRLRQPKTPTDKVIHNFNLLLRLGQKRGLPRQLCETPLEYITRLQHFHRNSFFPVVEVSQLTALFLQAVYSNNPIGEEQSEESIRLIKCIESKWVGQKTTEQI